LRRAEITGTAGYSAVAFWIHGGASGGQLLQVLGLRNGSATGQPAKIITPPAANTWTKWVIPLSELGIAGVNDFNGIWIQSRSGTALATFHVDDVALVGESDAAAWTFLTWDGWRQATFTAAELALPSISGPAADPDGDSLPNLAEWHLLGGPWSGAQILPNEPGGAVMALNYTRRISNPPGMVPEYSTDLKSWLPLQGWSGATTQTTPLDGSGLAENISWKIPLAGGNRCFVRLR